MASNLSVLASFGEGLMETVCRDACSGHDIARVGGSREREREEKRERV